VIETYAAVVAVGAVSLALGQAALALCGVRRWSWLAPAVGLALLAAICWGTVRLPGDGVVPAMAVLVLAAAGVMYLRGRAEGGREALQVGWPVALLALAGASIPFAVEGHFGILGTSFNPDMSQHLLTANRLAEGQGSQLLHQGYPLGPHAIVVALYKGLGIGLVQGFSGLTVAVAVLAPLTALIAFRDLPFLPRAAGALLVGLAYVVASYFAQGAFKETMQALYLLAFVLALREADRSWQELPLRFVPAALIAVGSVYTYSFPGLIWLGGAALIWAITEAARTLRANASAGGDAVVGTPRRAEDAQHPSTVGVTTAAGPAARGVGPLPSRALGLGLIVFLVLTLPELGRMIDFHSFETFDPNGPGLGNLFGQVSPFEALGIWPSGDFRLAPGDGAVPAPAYYLGIAFALVLLAYGLAWLWRRRETAILAGLAAAALAYAAARLGGTPYTAAKAIEIGAPLVALAILLPPLQSPEVRVMSAISTKLAPLMRAAAILFVLAAGACSLLALANAPVGPTSYSPALTGLRPTVEGDSTLVLASHQLLADEHGTPYVSWELRGGRVCIAAAGELEAPPPGVRFVVTEGTPGEAPFPHLRVNRVAPPFVLWEQTGPIAGASPCPLIAVRQARQGPAR
jgi:hypothetical protein